MEKTRQTKSKNRLLGFQKQEVWFLHLRANKSKNQITRCSKQGVCFSPAHKQIQVNRVEPYKASNTPRQILNPTSIVINLFIIKLKASSRYRGVLRKRGQSLICATCRVSHCGSATNQNRRLRASAYNIVSPRAPTVCTQIPSARFKD